MPVLLGKGVKIDPSARINVTEQLVIGDRSVIGKNVLIEGREIVIGREAWIDEYSHIGGGSCFEKQSSLIAGDFLHMGKFSHINTARNVKLGDEVGIGINTKIFTHGAYLSSFDGFPIQFKEVAIGNRVWLPNAWVNPGVVIGDDVVVAAMSLINGNVESGTLVGGIPAKVLKRNAYPRKLEEAERLKIMHMINSVLQKSYILQDNTIIVYNGSEETKFSLENKTISGIASDDTESLKNQLRRVGIRFKYEVVDGEYKPW